MTQTELQLAAVVPAKATHRDTCPHESGRKDGPDKEKMSRFHRR